MAVLPDQVDVVVVGAGLAGVSVAWWLRHTGSVLVLDQAEQPGAEASSQNAGMVRRLGEDPYERTLAVRVWEHLESPPTAALADPGLSRRTGAVLALAHDPYHLHDAASGLQARGVHIQALDRPSLDCVAPAMQGSPVVKAWHLPEERVADAHLLVSGLVRELRAAGARVACGRAVTEVIVQDGVAVGVVVDGAHRVMARRVVLAAGAWSRALAASAGLERPLIPLRRTLVQTAAHPVSSPAHPWCWVDDVGVYVRPEGGGWLVSGCDEAVDWPSQPGSRGSVEEAPRALAVDKALKWFPALSELQPVGGWTGLRTFAPDRRPVLGADPECPGLWWCAGLGGFGVTCGFAAGEAVAAWMQGNTVPFLRDPHQVSAGRRFFSRWPIRPVGDLQRVELVAV